MEDNKAIFQAAQEKEKCLKLRNAKELAIKDISVRRRFRKEFGDIRALAESIQDVGLLQPIAVDRQYRLIGGARRIEAFKSLGHTSIPCHVVDLEDLIRGEAAENMMRKDFTPSEAVAIAKALEPLERKKAAERERHGRPKRGENFTPLSDGTKSVDRLARAVGMSRPTLEKAKAVVASEDKDLIAKMDCTGRVDGAYRQLKRTEALKATEHY